MQLVAHEVKDIHEKCKIEAGHARRKAIEAGFRRKASFKDGAKLVQRGNESGDERWKERKEKS